MRRTRLRRQSAKRRDLAEDYASFVESIRERDGWRCRYCRDTRSPLDPHHVVKRSRAPRLLMDDDNVVTLCRTCHEWTDASYMAPSGRLVIDKLGDGDFAFSIVHGSSKWTVRR